MSEPLKPNAEPSEENFSIIQQARRKSQQLEQDVADFILEQTDWMEVQSRQVCSHLGPSTTETDPDDSSFVYSETSYDDSDEDETCVDDDDNET
jgi:hypothetical protein